MAGDRGRSPSEKSDYSGEGGRKLPAREDLEPGRKRRDERDDTDGETEEGNGSRRKKSEKSLRRSESDDDRKNRGRERSRQRSRKRCSSESDSDGSTSDDSDSESESESESSGSEEERRRRKRRERRRREEEKERKRRKEKKRRRKERDEEDDERRKRKKKKEKKRRKEKKRVERGKTGAVTNSWGKYGTIRETDMWTKRPEFTAWLAEVKQVNLEHLANWEEKQMFKDFMEDYNTATFPSKKYYNLDAFHKREMEKQLKKGMKKVQQKERTVFNDEEQRRLELQQERERQKEEEVNALKQSMQSGLAQAMKEQALLREEMAYQYKLGNFEAAAAIQRRLDPNIAP